LKIQRNHASYGLQTEYADEPSGARVHLEVAALLEADIEIALQRRQVEILQEKLKQREKS